MGKKFLSAGFVRGPGFSDNLIVFFLLAFLFCQTWLFASGKKEDNSSEPVNTEWTLCITAPDVSGLPLIRQVTGDTVSRSFAKTLQGLNFRLRDDEEALYYKDYAWSTSKALAAKALSEKRAERDLLIYMGDRPWKYRKNLKIIDKEILKLEEELAEIDSFVPAVEGKPVFKLVEANINGTFPAPPYEGSEYLFCKDQKADAFLVSSLFEYHGRIFLYVRMYTLYTNSFSFEDSALFSSDDLIGALDEISIRLSAAISAINQAGIIVQASPEGAMLSIDGSFAGKGEVHNYLPGTVKVDAHADNYEPVSVPVELNAGEIAELFVNLTPMGLTAFEVNVPDKPGSRVFIGSRYAGETPLSLELPMTEYAYISVETPDGEAGSMIYKNNDIVRGNARFVWTDSGGRADFNTRFPVSAEEKRVDRARRNFYIAYGAFWFILPASLLTASYARTKVEADIDAPLYTRVYYGAQAVWGTALLVTIFQIIRYLYVSGRDATPIIPVPKKEAEE